MTANASTPAANVGTVRQDTHPPPGGPRPRPRATLNLRAVLFIVRLRAPVLARAEVFRPWPQDQRPYPWHCRGVILIQ